MPITVTKAESQEPAVTLKRRSATMDSLRRASLQRRKELEQWLQVGAYQTGTLGDMGATSSSSSSSSSSSAPVASSAAAGGLSGGVIAAIVIAVVMAVLLLAILGAWLYHRYGNKGGFERSSPRKELGTGIFS